MKLSYYRSVFLLLLFASASFASSSEDQAYINKIVNAYKESKKLKDNKLDESYNNNNRYHDGVEVIVEFNNTFGLHRNAKVTIRKTKKLPQQNKDGGGGGSKKKDGNGSGSVYYLILPLSNEIYIDEYDTKLECEKCVTRPKFTVYVQSKDDTVITAPNRSQQEQQTVLINVESPSFDKDVIANGEVLTIVAFDLPPGLLFGSGDSLDDGGGGGTSLKEEEVVIKIMYHIRYLSPISDFGMPSRVEGSCDGVDNYNSDILNSCLASNKHNKVAVKIPIITLCHTQNYYDDLLNCESISNQAIITDNIPLGNMKHFFLVKVVIFISVGLSVILMSLGVDRL